MRFALFGSTATVGSFWVAAAVSWLTVTSGAETVVASRELVRTKLGEIAVLGLGFVFWSLISASCWRKPERVMRRPGVLFTEASLPARVLRS